MPVPSRSLPRCALRPEWRLWLPGALPLLLSCSAPEQGSGAPPASPEPAPRVQPAPVEASSPRAPLEESAAPAQLSGPKPLTIDEAVRIALASNRSVRAARLEVEKSGDRIAAAQGYYYPSIRAAGSESILLKPLEFEVKRGEFGTFPGIGPVPATNDTIETPTGPITIVGIAATQPLSQLYRASLGVGHEEVQGGIARERRRLEEQTVAADVKRTYYSILQLESAAAASRESLSFLRELDRVVSHDVEAGVAHPSESQEVKARLARQEYDALTISNGLKTQRERLNGLLGRDLDTSFEVVPLPPPVETPHDPTQALEAAIARRPEVEEARLKEKDAAYLVKSKQAAFIPDLSLSVGYLRQFNVEFIPEEVALAGLTLTWDIFDGGRSRRELAEARKTLAQAAVVRDETVTRISVEVSAMIRKAEEARALLRAARLGRDAAQAAQKVARDKYDHQSILLKDLLQAQTEAARAEYEYQQALATCWTSDADLERAQGEDNEAR